MWNELLLDLGDLDGQDGLQSAAHTPAAVPHGSSITTSPSLVWSTKPSCLSGIRGAGAPLLGWVDVIFDNISLLSQTVVVRLLTLFITFPKAQRTTAEIGYGKRRVLQASSYATSLWSHTFGCYILSLVCIVLTFVFGVHCDYYSNAVACLGRFHQSSDQGQRALKTLLCLPEAGKGGPVAYSLVHHVGASLQCFEDAVTWTKT